MLWVAVISLGALVMLLGVGIEKYERWHNRHWLEKKLREIHGAQHRGDAASHLQD